jgi:hypothetical protein
MSVTIPQIGRIESEGKILAARELGSRGIDGRATDCCLSAFLVRPRPIEHP